MAAETTEGEGEDGGEADLRITKSGQIVVNASLLWSEVAVMDGALTLSKHRTKMSIATLALPVVLTAAIPNTKHNPKYVASMYLGLKAFWVKRPDPTKRMNA